ncbi:MAG: hypothetical protein LBM98_10905 [Oscillospiraceae bacterium]|nr:hypothetical protein [Oscillospiraceae bacterium]
MRYAQGYRCEAIQCRSPQIRMFSSRHWIASCLYRLRISGLPALRKDAHGAWTGVGAWITVYGYVHVTSPCTPHHLRVPRAVRGHLIFDI